MAAKPKKKSSKRRATDGEASMLSNGDSKDSGMMVGDDGDDENGDDDNDGSGMELTGHEDPEWHSYLLMSTRSSTIVLSTGNELAEETTEFYTAGRTLAAGNVLSLAVIQIYRHGVRLVDRAVMVQENLWPPGVHATAGVVRDPYALVLLSDGTLRLLTTSERNGQPRFMVSSPDLVDDIKGDASLPSSIYLYRDNGRTQWWKPTTNLPLPGPPPVELPSTTPRARSSSSAVPLTPALTSATSSSSSTSFDPSPLAGSEIKVKPEPGLAFVTGPVKPPAQPGWSKGKDTAIEIIDVDELEEELLYGDTSTATSVSTSTTSAVFTNDVTSVNGSGAVAGSLEHAIWQRAMVKLETGVPPLVLTSQISGPSGFPGSSQSTALEIGDYEAEYMAIISRGGWIEIYSVPSFRRLFISPSLAAGRRVLENMPPELVTRRLQSPPSSNSVATPNGGSVDTDSYLPITDEALTVVEICVESLGSQQSLPYLMVHCLSYYLTHSLMVYVDDHGIL
jgi:hypothetical protein